MRYQHRFIVEAPLTEVAAFHRRSASMAAITPPPIIVNIHDAPVLLESGDEMRFTMWLGPFPIQWHAQIDDVTPNGFIDRQLAGPFTMWEHHHRFEEIDETKTAVIDEVRAELSDNWFWKVVGWGMWSNMALLFAFRGWKTKRLLKKNPKANEHKAHRPVEQLPER